MDMDKVKEVFIWLYYAAQSFIVAIYQFLTYIFMQSNVLLAAHTSVPEYGRYMISGAVTLLAFIIIVSIPRGIIAGIKDSTFSGSGSSNEPSGQSTRYRPYVTLNDADYVVRSLSRISGDRWKLHVAKRVPLNDVGFTTTITKSTRGGYAGRLRYEVSWAED